MLFTYPFIDDTGNVVGVQADADFLYLPSLPNLVFKTMKEQIDQLYNQKTSKECLDFAYILTQRTGNHKYMQSFIYVDSEKTKSYALSLVSNFACFNVMKDIINIIITQIQIDDEWLRENIGFVLSVFIKHIKINSSSVTLCVVASLS